MSVSINKAILVGNLGKDAELRYAQNGNKIVNLSIATNETWKNKETGLKEEKVEWHKVVIMSDKLAEMVSTLKKGARVYIEGKIQARKWTDKNGIDRITQEIIITSYNGDVIFLSPAHHVGGENFQVMDNKNMLEDEHNIIYEEDQEFPF